MRALEGFNILILQELQAQHIADTTKLEECDRGSQKHITRLSIWRSPMHQLLDFSLQLPRQALGLRPLARHPEKFWQGQVSLDRATVFP